MAPPAAARLLHTWQGQHQSVVPLTHDDGGRVKNLHWGLGRGLLSGLLDTTNDALEVPAGGWPPAKTLALFTLWASVSASLQKMKTSQDVRHRLRKQR